MISNNILLEVIHKDKFNREKHKKSKESILSNIKRQNSFLKIKPKNSIVSHSPVRTIFEECERNSNSEFGYSREIKGVSLQTKNKFVSLPKLLESTKKNQNIRKCIENNLKMISKHTSYSPYFDHEKSENNDFNYSKIDFNYKKTSECHEKINEYYFLDENFDTKLKSASNFLPKQKNFSFYSNETEAFKKLVKLNKGKREILESIKNEKLRSSIDYIENFNKKFDSKKIKNLIKNLSQKDNSNDEKDLKFVKEFFNLKQKSNRIKNLGYIQKREKIESLSNKASNIGAKFIEFFDKKNEKGYRYKDDCKNTQMNTRYKFETLTTQENNYEGKEADNFEEIFDKFKNEDSSRNYHNFKNEKSAENHFISEDIKEKIYFYSNSNFSNFNNGKTRSLFKHSPKHFVEKVQERLHKIKF